MILDEMISLNGKSALVTGGTSGNGRAIARYLAAEGARVLIYGRDKKILDDALSDMQGEVFGMVADQSKEKDLEAVFSEVDARFGSLDILVNNASIDAKSVTDSKYQDILLAVQTNLVGYMACTSFAVQRMTKIGQGDIVNIGSMSAVDREADGDIYTGIKAGVDGFTYALRAKVMGSNIRVILIEPGLVGTDMTASEYPPEKQREMQRRGEMLKAEDIARAVIYALEQPRRCDVIHMRVEPHIKSE